MKKLWLACVAIAVLFVSLSAALDGAPTSEDVRKMIRDVELPGDSYNTFALDMHLRLPGTPVHFLCCLRYQAPGDFSLHVFDGRDHTPVLVICDEMALINDPFAEKLSVIASAGVVFELQPQEGQYTANFAFNQPVAGIINNRIRLDFKTMFSRLQEDVKIDTASEGTVLFSASTKEQSRCLAELVASASLPLSALQLFVKEHAEPVLDFSMIMADAQFSLPEFPLAALQKNGLVSEPASMNGVLDTMGIMTSVIKAVFARAAISEPAMREKVSQMFNLGDSDWQLLSSRDTARSTMLRELFPENAAVITP